MGNNNLYCCETHTNETTLVSGNLSLLSTLNPQQHELIRSMHFDSLKCGTQTDYPDPNTWIQCRPCYSKTCKEFGFKEHVYKKQTVNQLHNTINLVLKQQIRKFFKEVKKLIDGAHIIKQLSDISIFTTQDRTFKVDFQKDIPGNDHELAKVLTRILREETTEQDFKRIRKVYLSKRKYGVIRIDIFAYPFNSVEDSTFAIGWGIVLSQYSREISQKEWEKEEKGLIRPKLEMYCKADIMEFNPHY